MSGSAEQITDPHTEAHTDLRWGFQIIGVWCWIIKFPSYIITNRKILFTEKFSGKVGTKIYT